MACMFKSLDQCPCAALPCCLLDAYLPTIPHVTLPPKLPSIANLMSPPEAKPLDSFSITPSKSHSILQISIYGQDSTLAPMSNSSILKTKIRVLPSLPNLPAIAKTYKEEKDRQNSDISGSYKSDIKDPVLYLETDSFKSGGEVSLFLTDLTVILDNIITKYKLIYMTQFDKRVNCLLDKEY